MPWVWLGGAVIVGWLVLITVLSAREAGSEGASSPPELADRASTALLQKDADALAGLFADPVTGDDDFARSYLDTLDSQGAVTARLVLVNPTRAEVRGAKTSGQAFVYPVFLQNDADRWYISAAPAI